jgi:hypothetical protein
MEKSIYEIVEFSLGGKSIKRTDPDGKVWFIPEDPANSDYQAYLIWLEEQPSDTE